MEAVGRLAGGIAHDFNNKLCVVIGYSEMLLRKMAPADPLREAAEQIHLAGRSAADLTRQLLIYSRKQAPEPKVLDLNVVLSRMEGQFTRLIGEDIRVRFRPAPCLGGVLIDPTYVEQVVLNLVVNARDAMPKGGELVIETADVDLDESYALHHPGMSAGPHVMLSVGDTGVGMDRDTLSHLFEPFFTTKEVGRGTGLGLSTVYGIVQQAKGGIDVSSQPGQGSTFRVYLPRVWAPAEASAIAFAPGDLPPGRERILVVEDDDKVRGLVVRILRQCGYEVLEAASPGHGAILAGDYSGSIDLLLADVVMPEMSGPELAEHIDAAGRGMEVVFISGHARDMLDKHKLDDQNFVLLQKPFSPEALAQVVRRALDKKAARR
jgi:CheY-like chemotaxis protein